MNVIKLHDKEFVPYLPEDLISRKSKGAGN